VELKMVIPITKAKVNKMRVRYNPLAVIVAEAKVKVEA